MSKVSLLGESEILSLCCHRSAVLPVCAEGSYMREFRRVARRVLCSTINNFRDFEKRSIGFGRILQGLNTIQGFA